MEANRKKESKGTESTKHLIILNSLNITNSSFLNETNFSSFHLNLNFLYSLYDSLDWENLFVCKILARIDTVNKVYEVKNLKTRSQALYSM